MLIWLLPGLRKLSFTKTRQSAFGYLVLAGLICIIPTAILQEYIPQLAARKIVLPDVSNINRLPFSRYYHVDTVYAASIAMRQRWRRQLSGRYNTSLQFHFYAAMPGYAKKPETNPLPLALKDTSAIKINPYRLTEEQRLNFLYRNPPESWLCLHWETSISNRLSEAEKQKRWQSFKEQMQEQLDHTDWNSQKEWEQVKNDISRQRLITLISSNERPSKVMLLTPRTSPLQPRHLFYLGWSAAALLAGIALFSFLLAITPLKMALSATMVKK